MPYACVSLTKQGASIIVTGGNFHEEDYRFGFGSGVVHGLR